MEDEEGVEKVVTLSIQNHHPVEVGTYRLKKTKL